MKITVTKKVLKSHSVGNQRLVVIYIVTASDAVREGQGGIR